MQQNEPFVTGGIDFDRAEPPQPRRVDRREDQLAATLQHDQGKDRVKDRHRLASSTNPALKPGPSAISNACFQFSAVLRARVRMRSATNSTEAADMLPYSASACRASASALGPSPNAASYASITFGPP